MTILSKESVIVERFLAKAHEEYLNPEWYCPTVAIELLKSDIRKLIEDISNKDE